MKITIDIPEDELHERVTQAVVATISSRITEQYYTQDAEEYRNAIRAVVGEVICKDIKNLEDRAVAAAAQSIKANAITELIERLAK